MVRSAPGPRKLTFPTGCASNANEMAHARIETAADPTAQIEALTAAIREHESVLVAFSGGVDSSVVAALAHRALGERALAVTGVSETLADQERHEADVVAEEIGISHRTVHYSELADESFSRNPDNRCYFCQTMRMGHLRELAHRWGYAVVASGTNASDTGEHRPGLQAMAERQVYQPLLDHGIDKPGVRTIARVLGLSVWDKPSMACLASRIPYGLRVTDERLTMIERAEAVIRGFGVRQARVRHHDGLARIEVAPDELAKVLETQRLAEISDQLKQIGFDVVTLDLDGYRSGRLDEIHLNEESP